MTTRLIALLLAANAAAASSPDTLSLRTDSLHAFGVELAEVSFAERPALRLRRIDGAGVALLGDSSFGSFGDGEILGEVAGVVDPEASFITRHFARGFVGVAFHAQEDLESYERIYLRPTNSRADDQLRRNHSTQYDSIPDHSWRRLRDDSPGKYESYVDLQPGVWTTLRIVVEGEVARLFVDGAPEPCLVVNDLKLGERRGSIGLFVGPGSLGYFRNLRVRAAGPAKGARP